MSKITVKALENIMNGGLVRFRNLKPSRTFRKPSKEDKNYFVQAAKNMNIGLPIYLLSKMDPTSMAYRQAMAEQLPPLGLPKGSTWYKK